MRIRIGSWKRWQLLNVRFVLDRRDLDGPGLVRIMDVSGVKLYEVSSPLPRAWLVNSVQSAGGEEATQIINSENFDPASLAVVPEGISLDLDPGSAGTGIVKVVESLPGRLVVDVPPAGKALLVVSQPFYPGWKARVDGKKTEILRVDALLQGIKLPAGAQQVELRYRPSVLPAIVSLLTLALAVGLLMASRRRSRHSEPLAN